MPFSSAGRVPRLRIAVEHQHVREVLSRLARTMLATCEVAPTARCLEVRSRGRASQLLSPFQKGG